MAFLIGNLLGRLIASALVVWFVMLFIKKLDFKAASRSMRSPIPLIAVLLVFILGLASRAI